MHLSPFIA